MCLQKTNVERCQQNKKKGHDPPGLKLPEGKNGQRVSIASGSKWPAGWLRCRPNLHKGHDPASVAGAGRKFDTETTLASPRRHVFQKRHWRTLRPPIVLIRCPLSPQRLPHQAQRPSLNLFSSSWDTLIIYSSIYSKQGIYCPTQFKWRKLHRTAHRRPTLGPPICGQTIVLLMSKSGPFTENNGQPS